MKNKRCEEKQLLKNLLDSDVLSTEIYKELDLIHKELDRKGKWNDFVLKLDSTEFRQEAELLINEIPENYYESLYVAFNIIDKYDEFKMRVNTAIDEAELLNGDSIESFKIPQDAINFLVSIGISIEPDHSDPPLLRIRKYENLIYTYFLNSRKILKSLKKALSVLRKSKEFIFSSF
jgi:hypothetical protein